MAMGEREKSAHTHASKVKTSSTSKQWHCWSKALALALNFFSIWKMKCTKQQTHNNPKEENDDADENEKETLEFTHNNMGNSREKKLKH